MFMPDQGLYLQYELRIDKSFCVNACLVVNISCVVVQMNICSQSDKPIPVNNYLFISMSSVFGLMTI